MGIERIREQVFCREVENELIGAATKLYGKDLAQLDELTSLSQLFTPGTAALAVYLVLMLGAAVAGLIMLCANAHRVRFAPAPQELPKGKRFTTAYCNVGMILLLLACLGMVALSAAA